MLRRTQSVAAQVEVEPEEAEHPEIVDVRPSAARAGDRRQTDRRQAERRQDERRQGDRRGMEALRAEALANVISMVEDRNFGGLRNRVSWSRGMPMSRILLLVVALCAGGLAAFLATQHGDPAQAAAVATMPVAPAPAPTSKILVAKADIGVGQRLSATTIEWADWPDAQMRDDYITASAKPEAIASMTGNIARADFFAGEPIRQQKLAPASGGYLSAVLEKGKRGVSVTVNQDAASGGFVVPNDHVDVVLTRQTDAGQDVETILTDVRVLAINARLGTTGGASSASAETPEDATNQVFADHAIATLELNPAQAEVIINAAGLGRLSLMLRAVDDSVTAAASADEAANAAIRISSPFWTAKAANR